MALQYSVGVRNGRLNSDEVVIGTAPRLQLWSGTKPANNAAIDAADGANLAEITLPSDWQAAAGSGVVDKTAGAWSSVGLAAAAGGVNITHFRLKDSAGTTCHIQGTVGTTAADMIVDNVNVDQDQSVTVTKFERTAGNA